MLVEFYRDKKKLYRWRITSRNGKVIGASTQGYKRKVSMEHNYHTITELSIRCYSDYEFLDSTKLK